VCVNLTIDFGSLTHTHVAGCEFTLHSWGQ